MKENQVTIKIERFGQDLPAEFKEMGMQVVSVYNEGDNVYEALLGAMQEMMSEL